MVARAVVVQAGGGTARTAEHGFIRHLDAGPNENMRVTMLAAPSLSLYPSLSLSFCQLVTSTWMQGSFKGSIGGKLKIRDLAAELAGSPKKQSLLNIKKCSLRQNTCWYETLDMLENMATTELEIKASTGSTPPSRSCTRCHILPNMQQRANRQTLVLAWPLREDTLRGKLP